MIGRTAGGDGGPAPKRTELQATGPEDARRVGGPRRVNVRDLLGGDRELILVYEAAEYRLRLTSNDKLILTK